MLTFIDTTGNHEGPLTVWDCSHCKRQFEFAFTDSIETDLDPKYCPSCGTIGK